jgi:hypothetical protein
VRVEEDKQIRNRKSDILNSYNPKSKIRNPKLLKATFVKTTPMPYSVEDLEDQTRFRLLLKVQYDGLLDFVLTYLREKSAVIAIFVASCVFFLLIAVYIRISIAGLYPFPKILLHTLTGLIILPVLSIPVHEVLHIIPYWLQGARDIRAGMDLSQYLFYVTAHRHVASPGEFRFVAMFPYLIISTVLILLIPLVPDLWKWSLSLFLFLHATMCAGDFALLNFYFLNRRKKIFTWDDAEEKVAFFYEQID